jgi:serine/threonine-protein kinase RsbW
MKAGLIHMSNATMHHILDSTLETVDRVEYLTLEFAERAGFRDSSLEQIALAVHETAANAVIHGNRYNPDKKVSVAISIIENQFTITISDEGVGFDPQTIPEASSLQEPLRVHGRGVYLSRVLMDEYRVQLRETGGAEVTLIKYLQPGRLVGEQGRSSRV